MFQKNKLHRILVVMLVLAFSFSTTAFAKSPVESTITSENQLTFEEAKEYLTTYSEVNVNEFGKEFTTEYYFTTTQDLDAAAAYIVEFGLDVFNEAVEASVEEIVSQESQSNLISPMTTDPTVAYATVSGNGTHTVSAETYGLASFDTLGTVEYSASLSYKVVVSSGKISGLSSISFDIPYISAAGSWGDVSLPFYTTDTNAGVTANYTITKELEVSIGDFGFIIKSETDNEIFALLKLS